MCRIYVMPTKKIVAKSVKTISRAKPRVYRSGTINIDRWELISQHLRSVAHGLSHCEHDITPIANLLYNCYMTAFGHGVVSALQATRKPLKVMRYDVPPDQRLSEFIHKFVAEMMIVHPEKNIPVSRNN